MFQPNYNLYPFTLTRSLESILIGGLKIQDIKDAPAFKYPWEILFWHNEVLGSQLENLVQERSNLEKKEGARGLYLARNVRLPQFAKFDTSEGLIIIDEQADIMDFCYLKGPLYIGKHTEIQPQTILKGPITIGHHCKIGGEVARSIIQPYTNKSHFGFIGDSLVGSWVNLGAGTSCSNLKNTYGQIKIDYPVETGHGLSLEKIDTDSQFLGCIIGDYAKCGINTSIMTGKMLGAGAQIIGKITHNVSCFTFASEKGMFELYLDAIIKTQKRMMSRRGIDMIQDEIEVLTKAFEISQDERERAGVRKEKIAL